MCDHFIITLPQRQPYTVFRGFISISGGWMWLCKELFNIMAEDSPHISYNHTPSMSLPLGIIGKVISKHAHCLEFISMWGANFIQHNTIFALGDVSPVHDHITLNLHFRVTHLPKHMTTNIQILFSCLSQTKQVHTHFCFTFSNHTNSPKSTHAIILKCNCKEWYLYI